MPQVIKNSNKFPILLSSIVIFDKYMLIYFFFSNIKKYEKNIHSKYNQIKKIYIKNNS